MSMNDSTCFTVTGHEFCNITVTWTPRVSVIGGVFAMILPAVYAVIMFILLYVRRSRTDDTSFWGDVKVTYRSITRLVYVKKRVGSDEYRQMKEQIKGGELDTEVTVEGTEVTLGDVQAAKQSRQLLCGKITLPLPCGRVVMVSKLIILPLFAIIWDLIDIIFDTYYFFKLERGGLIDPIIFRNTHVNNCILGFACVGAVKSTLVAVCYHSVVENNKNEREEHSGVVLATMFAVSAKLLLEDAPELVLEYFYVDKYIVVNPPWFLVGKDVITALIYILPLIMIIFSGVKDFRIFREDDDLEWWVAYILYIPTTIARGCMSLAMIFRIIGMIIQYMSSTVNKECFVVLDNTLLQTPFNTGCLTWCDWPILVLISLTLLSSMLPAIFIIVAIPYVLFSPDDDESEEGDSSVSQSVEEAV